MFKVLHGINSRGVLSICPYKLMISRNDMMKNPMFYTFLENPFPTYSHDTFNFKIMKKIIIIYKMYYLIFIIILLKEHPL